MNRSIPTVYKAKKVPKLKMKEVNIENNFNFIIINNLKRKRE